MGGSVSSAGTSPELLLEIIKIQTEIAKLGVDLGGVMALVAEHVQGLTGASSAIVELAEGSEMVYRAASGTAQSQLGLRLNANGSLSGLCVARGEVLRCDDTEQDDRVDREACRKVGLRSMVVAPLSHEGTVVGALKIASPKVAAFDAPAIQALELISGLVAAVMFHAAKLQTSELYHLATHDALTGLGNRALFYDRLRQNLALAKRQKGRFGILNFDMDGLKPINDQFGHGAGDAAIREAAHRISAAIRETDTVARLGGDEFGAILPGLQDSTWLANHVGHIEGRFSEPFHFDGRPLAFGCSIGMAVFPDDGTEIHELMDSADKRMYETKRTRKGRR